MARNDRSKLSIVAVSRNQESAFNEPQTLDLALETDKAASIPAPTFEVENNAGLVSGKEFPDTPQSAGANQGSAMPLTFEKLQPHELGWMAAYALGDSAAPVSMAQGFYRHVMQVSDAADRPSFSVGWQASDGEPVARVLFPGFRVDTMTIEGSLDESFISGSCECVGSGKEIKNIYREILEETHESTTLSLTRAVSGSTAAVRVDSLHRLLADLDGDEKFEVDVPFSAVSAANPAVVTMTPPYLNFERVVFDDNTVLTDYSEEAKSAASSSFTGALVATEDYLYVGDLSPFSALNVAMATPNATSSVLTVEYWNGTAWTAVTNMVDGTDNGGATLGQTGQVTFTEPSAWRRRYYGAQAKKMQIFWVRLSVSVNLDAGTLIEQIVNDESLGAQSVMFEDTSASSFSDETAEAASRGGSTVAMPVETADFFWVGSNRPFAGMDVIVDTPNMVAAVITAEYWDGSTWQSLSPTDGTINTGASIGQSGEITWTLPTDWEKSTVNSLEYYWVRMSWDDNLTAGTLAETIRLLDKEIQYLAVYRMDEATHVSELTSFPTTFSESAFSRSLSRVWINSFWNGSEIEEGWGYGCDLLNFTIEVNNNHEEPEYCWQGEGDGEFADKINRGDPEISISISKRFLDYLAQAGIRVGETFSFALELIGADVSGTNPVMRYRSLLYFDLCWYEDLAFSDDDGRHAEDITIRVGQSDNYPALIVVVENQDSTGYAQAA